MEQDEGGHEAAPRATINIVVYVDGILLLEGTIDTNIIGNCDP